MNARQVEHTKNERAVLVKMKDNFMVNLWGTFQDDTNLYMVLDFVAGGELFSLMRKRKVSLMIFNQINSRLNFIYI